jgi:hypothetical protein
MLFGMRLKAMERFHTDYNFDRFIDFQTCHDVELFRCFIVPSRQPFSPLFPLCPPFIASTP